MVNAGVRPNQAVDIRGIFGYFVERKGDANYLRKMAEFGRHMKRLVAAATAFEIG